MINFINLNNKLLKKKVLEKHDAWREKYSKKKKKNRSCLHFIIGVVILLGFFLDAGIRLQHHLFFYCHRESGC